MGVKREVVRQDLRWGAGHQRGDEGTGVWGEPRDALDLVSFLTHKESGPVRRGIESDAALAGAENLDGTGEQGAGGAFQIAGGANLGEGGGEVACEPGLAALVLDGALPLGDVAGDGEQASILEAGKGDFGLDERSIGAHEGSLDGA